MAAESQRSLQAAVAALGGSGEAVVVAASGDLRIIAVNAATQQLLGHEHPDGHGLEWLFPDTSRDELRVKLDALVRHGGRSMGMTARPRWEPTGGTSVPVRFDVVRRDGVPLVVAFVRDSPEDRALRPQVAAASPLAALPDRTSLLGELDAEARRAFRHGRGLAIVNVRLRGPGLDERARERAVIDAARRLREAVRAEETLGRSGPDSFAWILHEADAGGARSAADRARRAVVAQGLDGGAVSVGVASLTRGDSAADLLRRAELDTVVDPGAGRRGRRGASGLTADAERLLRAGMDGDARAVAETLRGCFEERGHAATYDEVVHPAMRRLARSGSADPERSPQVHRAASLLEWGLARRPRAYADPDAPVVAVLPMGVEARRVTGPSAADAAALAGWMPITLEIPPASDVTGPVSALSAQAVVIVVGDDSDLLETAHIMEDFAEAMPGVLVVALGPPGGVLRRWEPPPPARAVSSTQSLVLVLGGPSRRSLPAGPA